MYEKITLGNLMSGALEEKFQYELQKIKENIGDLNTDPKKLREITIKLKFKANEERDHVACISSLYSSLAPIKESGAVLSLTQQNSKLELFQETSKDIPLFNDDGKSEREINIKDVINQ